MSKIYDIDKSIEITRHPRNYSIEYTIIDLRGLNGMSFVDAAKYMYDMASKYPDSNLDVHGSNVIGCDVTYRVPETDESYLNRVAIDKPDIPPDDLASCVETPDLESLDRGGFDESYLARAFETRTINVDISNINGMTLERIVTYFSSKARQFPFGIFMFNSDTISKGKGAIVYREYESDVVYANRLAEHKRISKRKELQDECEELNDFIVKINAHGVDPQGDTTKYILSKIDAIEMELQTL